LSDADLVEAREAGLSDSRMVETVAMVAHIIFTNYLNNVAHTDVDFAPVEG
jgi:alkylhydroperoxidase family enzyme